jgi:alkyldihydroxyacetonephosphate synthase
MTSSTQNPTHSPAQKPPSEIIERGQEVLEQYSRDRWPLAAKRTPEEEAAALPEAVLFPRDTGEVATVLRAAKAENRRVVPYGGGSGVVGSAVPSRGEWVLSLRDLKQHQAPDEKNLRVTVGAGLPAIELEEALNNAGYTLGHYPQSLPLASVGGLVATRSTGTFSNKYGGIEDLVLGLRAVLADGTVVEYPPLPRAAMGPDTMQLFIGAEGSLGVITEVTLKIFPLPEARVFHGFRFRDIDTGLTCLESANRLHLQPAVLRLYDAEEAKNLYQRVNLPAEGCLLITGHEGVEEMTQAELRRFSQVVEEHQGESLGNEIGEAWEGHRYNADWLDEGNDGPGKFADAIEVAVDWQHLGAIYHEVRAAIHPLCSRVMAHYSHFYSTGGCLYFILFIDETDPIEARRRYLECWEKVMSVTARLGGALSHHHGVGRARAACLPAQWGSALEVYRRVKQRLDPENKMNPGKFPGGTES